MRVDPITNTEPNFGVRVKPTRKIPYASNCFITEDLGVFKNKKISITKNYVDNELTSTLYYVKDNLGNWVKSKLKCFKGNKVVQELRGECERTNNAI